MFPKSWRSIVLIVGETALLVAAVAAASYLRLGEDAWPLLADPGGFMRVLAIAVVCQLCLHYADLYNVRVIAGPGELMIRLMQAVGATSVILAAWYYWFPEWVIGRGV